MACKTMWYRLAPEKHPACRKTGTELYAVPELYLKYGSTGQSALWRSSPFSNPHLPLHYIGGMPLPAEEVFLC
ncbi:hypothetical protein O163_13765 [Caldanaerobacter subterraneus subsp. yonseiensis KB-1]|uniref:Uncharacterized protein n=1 Tax=Caldanaerobacter subterraneus subsp. yonseiensis KB-1 TaxID=1388761 RepID=U5CM33_CALSX|nr:hypothetical protein O163_13765 [Caldanaerobacter subterraneus subsp. yonseiensis KB-1]